MFYVSSFHPTGDHPQGGKFHDRRGNVLLLAILLLTGGIVGGLTIAVLVVSEIRQAQSLDNALVGYYDAEGGLEQSLYDIRQADKCAGGLCDTAYIPCQGDAKCKVKINPSVSVDIPLISVDDTFQLDIEPGDGILSIEVVWAPADPAILPYLEVSFLNIESGNTIIKRPNFGVPYSCAYDSGTNTCQVMVGGTPENLSLSDIDYFTNSASSKTYQVRFKALGGDINNLQITSLDPADGKFSGYLEVASRSQKTSIRQELKTSVPSQLPVYGFPDYVIFSEQDIVK